MEDEDQDQYEREGEEEEGANRRLTLPTGDAIGPRARSRTPPCRTRSPLFEGRSGVCCYSRGMQRGQDIVMSEPARTCRVSPGNKVARLTVKMRKGGNVRPLLRMCAQPCYASVLLGYSLSRSVLTFLEIAPFLHELDGFPTYADGVSDF